MRAAGHSVRYIVGLWVGIALVSGLAAGLGYLLPGRRAPDDVLAFVMTFAAGAILSMLASTMLPEAAREGGPVIGLVTSAGFLAAVLHRSTVRTPGERTATRREVSADGHVSRAARAWLGLRECSHETAQRGGQARGARDARLAARRRRHRRAGPARARACSWLFAGLALLSQQYEWAERRVEPIKEKALKAAAEGVETTTRITLSVIVRADPGGLRRALDLEPARPRVVAGPRPVVAGRRDPDRHHPDRLGPDRDRDDRLQLPPVPLPSA